MILREGFNPYNLDHVADIDKYIKEWKERKLVESTKAPSQAPTRGILKPIEEPKPTARS